MTHDLDWLLDERPEPLTLEPATTEHARDALLAHAVAVRPVTAVPARAARHASKRRYRITAAAGVAAVVVAALVLGLGGFASSSKEAFATPLTKLAAKVQHSPAPTGDATLILRHQMYPNEPAIDGADLYLDNGAYYYSGTVAGLPAALHDSEIGEGVFTRETAAAVAALTLPLAEARTRMADSPLDPNAKQAADSPERNAELEKKQELATANGATTSPPMRPMDHENAMIWSNSLDALTAGAGRSDVRAGVLRLLASIPTVAVAKTTTAGVATLTLTARVFPDGYQEQLVIDANTGAPVSMTGGNPGKTPDVVVTYTVSRVTAAEIAAR